MNPKSFYVRYALALGLLMTVLVYPGCHATERGVWELVHAEGSADAASVVLLTFDSKEEGWALTFAELSKLSEQGRTWVPVLSSDGKRAFGSFVFATPDNGFLVGSQHKGDVYSTLMLHTSDRGKTWQEVPTNARTETDRHKAPALYSLSLCGEKNGWAVGSDIILHTTDGQTWQTQVSNLKFDVEGLFSVACSDSQRAWAVGMAGLALRTVDGGKNWTRKDLATKDTLTKVKFFNNKGWIIGGSHEKSLILRTLDGGETWQPQSISVGALLFDICFVGNQGWIAGEHGTIMHSDDGGQTWLRQKTPTTEDLTSLFFISASSGWAGGNRGTLLRFSQ